MLTRVYIYIYIHNMDRWIYLKHERLLNGLVIEHNELKLHWISKSTKDPITPRSNTAVKPKGPKGPKGMPSRHFPHGMVAVHVSYTTLVFSVFTHNPIY
jgi:hypothetical protein